MDDNTELVHATIKEHMCVDEVTNETTLESLGVDSLDIVEIVMSLEQTFNITIEDNVLENIKTVGDIVTVTEEIIND